MYDDAMINTRQLFHVMNYSLLSHVHILYTSLLAVEEEAYGRIFLLLSLTAHVSLFPLLHQPAGMCLLAKYKVLNKHLNKIVE